MARSRLYRWKMFFSFLDSKYWFCRVTIVFRVSI